MESSVKYLYYFISTIVCFFLILLAGKILDDLGSAVTYPNEKDFHNQRIKDSLNNVKLDVELTIETYNNSQSRIQEASKLASDNYDGLKKSFENWLLARKTIGEPSQDREVIARAYEMDNSFKIQQQWSKKTSLLSDTLKMYQNKIVMLDNQLSKEDTESYARFNSGLQKYELKAFLIRLLFIFPILALGIYFYLKKRKDKYAPIYLGFTLFALYAFFVQLVPYLPSYGGYLRYTVGILLSIAGGYYAINNIRTYLERRKAILQESSTERMKKVQSNNSETAFKAYDQHLCPSCGKDYIYKNWSGGEKENELQSVISNFCRQCGLQLYKKCEKCGEKHFTHLPFCSNCGDGKTTES